MIRRRALAGIAALVGLATLAACGAPDAPDAPGTPLRDPAARVASQSDVTLARLSGDWIVVQGAGRAPGTRVSGTARGLRLGPDLFTEESAGRFRNGSHRLWVHWLDSANRTAALGDPMGRAVWIMDRSAGSSPDRLRAAREILAWYGYDLRRLKGV